LGLFMPRHKRRTAVVGACAAVVATGLIPLAAAHAQAQSPQVQKAGASHVLLISVDGLHQSDLTSYVKAHPTSALASLVARGTSYTHAQTPIPSGSFPGRGPRSPAAIPAPPASTTTTPTTTR
jgi:predicted AlkP superfamily pyrophosphatase or phosphodiesterase